MIGLALNLRNSSVTQLDGDGALGMAQSDSDLLLVNDGGLFHYGSATDNGNSIPWSIKTPLIDFGQVVSLRAVELLGEFGGDFTIRVCDDRGSGRDYPVYPPVRKLKQSRIKVPLGSRSHFGQYHFFELSGEADVSFDGLRVLVVPRGSRWSG